MRIVFMALLACLALATAGCASQNRTSLAPYTIVPGHIDLSRGPDGNSVVLDAPEGLIVVDSGRHLEHVQAILDFAHVAGRPIVAIVNTHWHLDHTTGNRDIRLEFPHAEVISTNAGKGALVGFLANGIARTKAMIDDPATTEVDRMAAIRRYAAVTDSGSFLPGQPVTNSGPRNIAGRMIEMHVSPAAVTEADLWLVLPNERLAIVGDLVVAQSPFFDTGCENGWSAALDSIAKADWDFLVPGHGALMTRPDFARWREAFDGFLDCARSDAPAAACSERWLESARGFYTEAEADSVRRLGEYYVLDVLRAPTEKRMPYCRVNGGD